MKTLLLKIQERLDSKLTYLPMKSKTEKAVYITTDGKLPDITDFPAVGLKDGSEKYELVGGMNETSTADEFDGEFEVKMIVRVTGFVRIYREEDILTGDPTVKGILEVLDDIRTALTGWLPDSVYNLPLIPVRAEESQIYVPTEGDAVYIQNKDILFICARQL